MKEKLAKKEFYIKELKKTLTNEEYTLEIVEKKTKKYGVACTNKKDVSFVSCFYGNDNGEDDCYIPFEEFFEKFEVVRTVDETIHTAYTVVENNGNYELVEEN